ncbi:XRE family transcriptional regulator [Methylobacterium aquaticum]|uniref:XRE family transcriptional regulator n=1 Tax=Methylobacterium aquaticum TaxID=270351 RepID=UPI003D17C1B1
MSTFAERLESLRSPPKQSDLAFSKGLGVSNSLLRKYLRGANPGLDNLVRIARAKNVRVEWLATGEGPRDIQPTDGVEKERTKPEQAMGEMVQSFKMDAVVAAGAAQSTMISLPMLGVEASAGPGIIPDQNEQTEHLALREEYLREIGVNPKYAHVLRVSGRSMAPTINDRDIVVVDTSARALVSEGIYTLNYGEAVLIKRVQMLRDGGVNIISDNKSEGYRDEFVPRSELHTLQIVGRVKGQIRAL